MQNKINQILQKGKLKNAQESDRQEMLALFHRADVTKTGVWDICLMP